VCVRRPSVYPCVRACVRTSVRPCVRPCVSTSVRTSVRAYVRACVRASVRACVRTSVRAYVRAYVRPCVRLSVRTSVRACIRASPYDQVFRLGKCGRSTSMAGAPADGWCASPMAGALGRRLIRGWDCCSASRAKFVVWLQRKRTTGATCDRAAPAGTLAAGATTASSAAATVGMLATHEHFERERGSHPHHLERFLRISLQFNKPKQFRADQCV
jgi:hypothetical protein